MIEKLNLRIMFHKASVNQLQVLLVDLLVQIFLWQEKTEVVKVIMENFLFHISIQFSNLSLISFCLKM